MKNIILAKYGEIALKGNNKSTFESILVKNIRQKIYKLGEFKIHRSQSTIYIEPTKLNVEINTVISQLKTVFGIATISNAIAVEKDIEIIKSEILKYFDNEFINNKSFKITSKRSDKLFAMSSYQICCYIGEQILAKYKNIIVDVNAPDININIEIREKYAFIFTEKSSCAKGMPTGSSGKALLLISGGIDSPVAGYMMAKRGISVSAIHFSTPPYTSERALNKVEMLCEQLCQYLPYVNLYNVNFTNVQLAIRKYCDDNLSILIMRRFMMKISEEISKKNGYQALITGESLGQVASQTIHAINCTNNSVTLPIFRPLIGMDKNEIINIAKNIGTFETSILPYEDCCTIFTPKHPKTKPRFSEIINSENNFHFKPLLDQCINNIELKVIKNNNLWV